MESNFITSLPDAVRRLVYQLAGVGSLPRGTLSSSTLQLSEQRGSVIASLESSIGKVCSPGYSN